MWQVYTFWTCNCYKTRIKWKVNSLLRRKKNCDILRYEFRIAIRYKFFVYCDISIYCDTPMSDRNVHFHIPWDDKSILSMAACVQYPPDMQKYKQSDWYTGCFTIH